MIDTFLPLTNLVQSIIEKTDAENRRRHELKMAEISLIANSQLRDAYVQQLLLDKFLAPVENAQHQIQNTAKHAQWLAEMVSYYYQYHNATKEEAEEVARQLRHLAVYITQVDSLYELKIVYQVVTLFCDQISRFKHPDCKYSWEREIRQGILNPLNTCIAVETNFQRRISLSLNDKLLPSNSNLLES